MTDPTPAAGGLSEVIMPPHAEDCAWSLIDGPCTCGLDDFVEAITEAADREAARVTAAVEALADAWDDRDWRGHDTAAPFVRALRAALSSAGTEVLDRERAKAWDEGWNACFGYLSAEYVGPDDPPNPYRAAAVSPEGGGA